MTEGWSDRMFESAEQYRVIEGRSLVSVAWSGASSV